MLVIFEKVSKYINHDDICLPVRKTKESAGYDFQASETIVVPSYLKMMSLMELLPYLKSEILTLSQMQEITKENKLKPTLVPTGIKAQIDKGFFLQLSVRSSCPLKNWLILANGVGKQK